jgi:hypothetical protein
VRRTPFGGGGTGCWIVQANSFETAKNDEDLMILLQPNKKGEDRGLKMSRSN